MRHYLMRKLREQVLSPELVSAEVAPWNRAGTIWALRATFAQGRCIYRVGTRKEADAELRNALAGRQRQSLARP